MSDKQSLGEHQCIKCRDYQMALLTYKQQSISEKEVMRKDIQKSKQLLQKFMSKIDKRVDSRINEERLLNNHHMQKLQQFHKEEISKMQKILYEKDKFIEQMRETLRRTQKEKKQLIQSNTKVLVEMGDQIRLGGDKKQENQKDKRPYWQLMKMYQFLIEQNNDLKKEIYMMKRNNFIKPQKSLRQSQMKPKSPTLYSSDNMNISKSFHSREGDIKQLKEAKKIKVIPKTKKTKK